MRERRTGRSREKRLGGSAQKGERGTCRESPGISGGSCEGFFCAIFTSMDPVSEEVVGICRNLKLSVPGEVMVLGVDNDEEICEHSRPTLSSIGQDFERAGYLAAELLGFAGDSLGPLGR